MSGTTQKNFRLSTGSLQLLDAVRGTTGMTDTKIVELCLAAYALGIGIETRRARQFLFDNMRAMIATASVHHPHPKRLNRGG